MAYDESAYGAAAYSADSVTDAPPPGEVLPPPIPDGSTAYYYAYENGEYPWAWGGWAGARPQIADVYGGIVVVPDPDTGTVALSGWWPDATYLHFIRLHEDGTRYPVRGGYGVVVPGSDIYNYVTNPSLETGLNGYVSDVGTPSLSRVDASTVSPVDRQWSLRATIAGAGSLGVTVPTTWSSNLTGTAAASLRFSARPVTLSFTIGWVDSIGGALTGTTLTFTDDQINDAVAQWGRFSSQFTPPTGAVTSTFKIVATGLPAGATMDVDAVLLTGALTDGAYFDGASIGGYWQATEELSVSSLSPVVDVVDPDCPLDVPIRYLVANPALTGGRATSSYVTLQSQGRWCWLTHPRYAAPVRCDLREVPVLEHSIEQGVFYPIGRRRALTVSTLRRAPSTELVFNADSFAERDTLLTLMSDGEPMLVRAPAAYGYGTGTWWSLGNVTEDREGRLAYHDAMTLTASCVEVDPPTPYSEY